MTPTVGVITKAETPTTTAPTPVASRWARHTVHPPRESTTASARPRRATIVGGGMPTTHSACWIGHATASASPAASVTVRPSPPTYCSHTE